jgi:hypothetical protein
MEEPEPAKDLKWKPPDIMKLIKRIYKPTDRNRMYARLMTHMSVDVWMTYELMEVAIRRIVSDNSFPGEFKLEETIRDTTSSEVAKQLGLDGKDADNFCSFQGIKIDSQGEQILRHTNRPDGTFILDLKANDGSSEKMVLFYEGDDHAKDANKTLTTSCKNSHKMYQYFAQSQSFNPAMAGCAIFANMFHGYPDVTSFLDSMYKAHMFAFAVIAHYNFEDDKTKTALHSLLDMKKDIVYDFVIGINMDLKDSTSFKDAFFTTRTKTISGLFDGVDITINDDVKKLAEITKTTFRIDNVIISIIGIPRLQKFDWENGIQEGCFVYPKDIATVVQFENKICTESTEKFQSIVNVKKNGGSISVNFRTDMSGVKTILFTENRKKLSKNSRDYSQSRDINGFLLVALPIAYYTISQFESVNNLLKYKYSSSQKRFKPLLVKFIDGLSNRKTEHIKVEMFDSDTEKNEKTEKTSLFREICDSVQKNPDIDDDFKTFLNEVCRWNATNESTNPAIFFRSMRILSLKNAIDFAFEYSNQQNPIYTKMLSIYPIGTQIILKQCLQNLNEGGIAYLSRIHENASFDSSDLDEDEDDDDDDDDDGGIFAKVKAIVEGKTTFWNVDVDLKTESEDLSGFSKRICDQLLAEYKLKIKWRIVYDVVNDNVEPLPEADKLEAIRNIYSPFEMNWILNITEPDQKYKALDLIFQPIINPEFVCEDEDVFNAVQALQKKDDVHVIKKWGRKFIKFTLQFTDKKEMLVKDVKKTMSWFGRWFSSPSASTL